MKISEVIMDTGPLVAALSAKDEFHGWAQSFLNELPVPWLTCEAVLSETFFRLRKNEEATTALCELIDESAIKIVPVRTLGAIARYIARYRVDFADACLVALSEQFPAATLVTIDRRDFTVLRRFGREAIPFLAP